METVSKVGKFSITGTIGSGGFSTVYRCREEGTRCIYAIKVGNENINEEFKRKAKTIDDMTHMEEWHGYKALGFGKGVAHSRGIPEVFETGIAELPGGGMRPYLVMQLLGKNLGCAIASSIWKRERVFELVPVMIDCLEYIHNKGYIHRDIKPSNFCFGLGSERHRLFIMDLGFACETPTMVDRRKVDFVGTPDYASTTGLRGCRQSYRDDMESLAYTILEMWMGDLPWYLTNGETIKNEGWTRRNLIAMANKRDKQWKTLVKEGKIPSFLMSWVRRCKTMGMIDIPEYSFFKQLIENAREQHESKYKRKNAESAESHNKRRCQAEE